MASKYIEIGEIVRPQGIRGEIKLRAGGAPERYAALKNIYLKENNAMVPHRVLKARASDGFAVLLLEGIEDRNAAENLRGHTVYADRDAFELNEDENFISDLIGLHAQDTHGNPIGILRDVLSPNAVCDVYVFDTPRGEMMLPALKRVILTVDIDAGVMTLDENVLPEVAVWQDEPVARDDQ